MVERNRLGELLVIKGLISSTDLRFALKEQKSTQLPLGEIFLQHAMISRRQLTMILAKQYSLRMIAALVLTLTALATVNIRKAHADDNQPAVAFNAAAGSGYGRLGDAPGLFGTSEKRSGNLKPFTKWAGMFSRYERDMNTPTGARIMAEWKENLKAFQGLPLKEMAERVNDLANRQPYINDSRNWGTSDYWETPIEFMQRGGDCEDFAIAKYAALKILGVPEERLRVAIVHDNVKNIPHAILAVYTDDGIYILDNQNKSLVDGNGAGRYRPIFSINRTAWWLHASPDSTMMASAQ